MSVVPARRFDRSLVAAIVYREWLVFRGVWFSTAFGSIVEPLVYFLAFGFGFGALVSEVAGLSYLEFIATGTIAIGILFSSMFPALIVGYFRRKENHTYDSLLATPLTVEELVTGEAVWNSFRVTAVSVVTLLVAIALGVRPNALAVMVVPLSLLGGFGFALAGTAFGAKLKSTHSIDFVIVGVIVPMYVIAGTFFPLDGLPTWTRVLGQVNPLTHLVELLRAACFGGGGLGGALGHLAVVVGFDVLAWLVAVQNFRGALID